MPAGPPATRGGAGARRKAAVVLAWAVLSSVAAAQGIGFTVQVIAVSDQGNALDISRGLLREGFPAYVVRSTGGQGDVYRVRVGAFANRAAAVRYAAAMPGIGGARPVPALAEAIPGGIMPLAPRALWQSPLAGADLRVLPWPDGVALRRQAVDPLRQATYDLVQGAEVRTVQAWRLAPLAELPPSLDLLEVPFVDLTLRPAPTPAPAAGPDLEDVGDTGAASGDAAAEVTEAQAAGVGGAVAEPAVTEVEDAAAGPAGPPPVDAVTGAPAGAVAAPVAALPAADDAPEVATEAGTEADAGPRWADVAGAEREVGLLLLRDRSLWPPTWADDSPEVRMAFREATLSLVANRTGLDLGAVEAHAYFPGGGPPPALVVVELSDRSGRDLADVRGLADPRAGLRPEGPPPAVGLDADWWPVGGIGERVPLDVPADGPTGGADWTLAADGGFVRITTVDGANWRAAAGVPLWSDGRYALVRDGDDLVLFDFVPR